MPQPGREPGPLTSQAIDLGKGEMECIWIWQPEQTTLRGCSCCHLWEELGLVWGIKARRLPASSSQELPPSQSLVASPTAGSAPHAAHLPDCRMSTPLALGYSRLWTRITFVSPQDRRDHKMDVPSPHWGCRALQYAFTFKRRERQVQHSQCPPLRRELALTTLTGTIVLSSQTR